MIIRVLAELANPVFVFVCVSVSGARVGVLDLLLGAVHEASGRLGWKTKVAELAVSVASQEILAQKRAK